MNKLQVISGLDQNCFSADDPIRALPPDIQTAFLHAGVQGAQDLLRRRDEDVLRVIRQTPGLGELAVRSVRQWLVQMRGMRGEAVSIALDVRMQATETEARLRRELQLELVRRIHLLEMTPMELATAAATTLGTVQSLLNTSASPPSLDMLLRVSIVLNVRVQIGCTSARPVRLVQAFEADAQGKSHQP